MAYRVQHSSFSLEANRKLCKVGIMVGNNSELDALVFKFHAMQIFDDMTRYEFEAKLNCFTGAIEKTQDFTLRELEPGIAQVWTPCEIKALSKPQCIRIFHAATELAYKMTSSLFHEYYEDTGDSIDEDVAMDIFKRYRPFDCVIFEKLKVFYDSEQEESDILDLIDSMNHILLGGTCIPECTIQYVTLLNLIALRIEKPF